MLTFNQMNTVWWIVDCSVSKNDVIRRIGKTKYQWYYPLYLLTKNEPLRRMILQRIHKNRKIEKTENV
jgi:hypothetical protein